MNEIMAHEEVEEIVTMIKHMVVDYVDIDGRMFISAHDSETTRTEIIRHFNHLTYECIKFIRKYDSILSDNVLNKCIKDISSFIKNAKDLMLDLYDDDLSVIEVTKRAMKRGLTLNEF